jgi:hypothetical protein
MNTVRKALYSPGYGAGWSTWNEHKDFFLFDAELIAAVEAGTPLGYNRARDPDRLRAKYGDDTCPYLGGARDLAVIEVHGPFRVTEYDGYEGIEYRDAVEWQ